MNIRDLTDEILCAYLDGELSPEARAELERQLPGEPGARVRLDRFRDSDERLRRAFALPPSAHADPLVRLLTADAPIAQAPIPVSRLRRYAAPVGLALAATVVGLAIGFGWRAMPGSSMPAMPGDAGPALLSAGLVDALDRNVSGIPRAGVTVIFTFLRANGSACRQFEVAGDAQAAEGVACRSDDRRWQLSAWRETSIASGGYRTAGGGDSPIETVVDDLDVSGPLSPAEEAALIAKGWQDGR